MSCGWCGHGYCHHHECCHHCGYAYGPPPYWAGYGPGYGPRRRSRRQDEEDLAAYQQDLEEEIGRVREDLADLRRPRPAEGS